MLFNMKHVISFVQSNQNYPEYKLQKVNAFPENEYEVRIGFTDRLDTNGFVNNNNQVLDNIINILPNDYQTEKIGLDKIQHDFRLGANTKFFKLKTYNGSFVFCSTYFEDEEKIGKFELRIYRIEDYFNHNFKL